MCGAFLGGFFWNGISIAENKAPASSNPVRVQATVIPVDGQSVEGFSQAELRKLVEAAQKNGVPHIVELTTVGESGKWANLKRGSDIWYPTQYKEAAIYQGEADIATYSIPNRKPAAGKDSYIIPASVVEADRKETGFF